VAGTKTTKKKTAKKDDKIYAIVQTGGKQYKVSVGQTIDAELLSDKEGSNVELERVLLVSDGKKVTVGTPTVAWAKVVAEVMGNGKSDKVTIFKYKPKVRYRRMKGHRQPYTRLAIREIVC
jgi:large subunit ribosomal protein L21